MSKPSLSPSVPSRQLLHTREIVCAGYVRSDGLFEIESSMKDISAQGSDLFFKRVDAGDAIHAMRVVVTVDADLVILHIEVHTDIAPTPYCADSNLTYEALRGLKIGPGFTKKVRALLGGTKGCTHLTELLGPLATTAIQTWYAVERKKNNMKVMLRMDGPFAKPIIADTCQAYRTEGEAMKQVWPMHRRTT